MNAECGNKFWIYFFFLRHLGSDRACRRHEYKINDYVFVNVPDRDSKLDLVRKGPFPIIQAHTNNTVTVQSGPVQEWIN